MKTKIYNECVRKYINNLSEEKLKKAWEGTRNFYKKLIAEKKVTHKEAVKFIKKSLQRIKEEGDPIIRKMLVGIASYSDLEKLQYMITEGLLVFLPVDNLEGQDWVEEGWSKDLGPEEEEKPKFEGWISLETLCEIEANRDMNNLYEIFSGLEDIFFGEGCFGDYFEEE